MTDLFLSAAIFYRKRAIGWQVLTQTAVKS